MLLLSQLKKNRLVLYVKNRIEILILSPLCLAFLNADQGLYEVAKKSLRDAPEDELYSFASLLIQLKASEYIMELNLPLHYKIKVALKNNLFNFLPKLIIEYRDLLDYDISLPKKEIIVKNILDKVAECISLGENENVALEILKSLVLVYPSVSKHLSLLQYKINPNDMKKLNDYLLQQSPPSSLYSSAFLDEKTMVNSMQTINQYQFILNISGDKKNKQVMDQWSNQTRINEPFFLIPPMEMDYQNKNWNQLYVSDHNLVNL